MLSGVSPSIQDYNIYCDETFLRKQVAFAFGGLICTPRRAEILRNSLQQIRLKYNYFGEVKWKKVSHKVVQIYKDFIDLFLHDPFARFVSMKVKKGSYWKGWGSSEEERFFKAYYVFLMRNIGPYSRFYVYPDEKPIQKNYRWDRLHFLINRARRDNWGIKHRNIKELRPLNSKDEDLLQLTDLLLGCLTSNAGANAKMLLQQWVYEHLTDITERGGFKFRVEEWTPNSSE